MGNNDTALVLGGDGLLGSHLVRQLIEGGWQVRVLVHPRSDSPTLDGLDIDRRSGDLTAGDDLAQAARGCRAVFHCAAITDLWAPPGLVWEVNLHGTRRVIRACLDGGVERLVFTGSASSFQFGSLDAPGDEAGDFPDAYRGIPYMESKYRAMREVERAVAEDGLDAVTVAPTFLLGDLDFRPSSGELIRQFIQRRMLFTSPGGRNFAYAPDVAAALIGAFHEGVKGRRYIAGGQNLTYKDFFSRVAAVHGEVPAPKFILPGGAIVAVGAAGTLYGRIASKRPPLDLRTARLSLCGTYYSPARAVAELGMPQTPIETGIQRSLDSLRSYGHI